ncbi:hypothetical protein BDZ89DRAFT_1065463 [Hymenopellis radicata]|nr:hypothetical protein BDZ89DRAFT_1065463 [Hymenopellis radicata]
MPLLRRLLELRTAQAAHSTTEWHPSQGQIWTGWWCYGAPFFASISALRFVRALSLRSLQFRGHKGC